MELDDSSNSVHFYFYIYIYTHEVNETVLEHLFGGHDMSLILVLIFHNHQIYQGSIHFICNILMIYRISTHYMVKEKLMILTEIQKIHQNNTYIPTHGNLYWLSCSHK